VATTPAVASAQERPGDAQPWVLYQSSLRNDEFGAEGIFLIRSDGSGDHEIATDVPGEHIHPAWSHDGRQIVFAAGDDGHELVLVNANGSGSHQISHCSAPCDSDDDPALSPSDHLIAYLEATGPWTQVGDGFFPTRDDLRVAAIGKNGLAGAKTLYIADPLVYLDEPRWSPDGSHLVFWQERSDASGHLADTAVFTIRSDGRDLRQLTPWSHDAGEADWSPDGRSIVFVTHPLLSFNFDAVVSNLYTIRPDGTGLRALTHFTTPDVRATQARWTPDGAIVFTLVDSNGRSLATVDKDGRQLTVVPQGNRWIRTHGDVQPVTPCGA
jgi:Tol biopolymer transport system component